MSQVTLLRADTRYDAIGIFEDERGHAGVLALKVTRCKKGPAVANEVPVDPTAHL